ncbi:hypothetical protein Pan216_13690 [Planctomycetes bacterium Pan216]|uniref:Uncharacterized protein n=1 Tax=Kolteria novifilia TaxID=2527975 RepID=A0A518B0M1_9BACT|nr:hypothetical protein Pan216_13690 [Planctomycetes bacterium Pan216]
MGTSRSCLASGRRLALSKDQGNHGEHRGNRRKEKAAIERRIVGRARGMKQMVLSNSNPIPVTAFVFCSPTSSTSGPPSILSPPPLCDLRGLCGEFLFFSPLASPSPSPLQQSSKWRAAGPPSILSPPPSATSAASVVSSSSSPLLLPLLPLLSNNHPTSTGLSVFCRGRHQNGGESPALSPFRRFSALRGSWHSACVTPLATTTKTLPAEEDACRQSEESGER